MKEKTLQLKTDIVNDIKAKFEKAQCAILVDYRGLTVEQDTDLRNKFRAAGVEYKVLKNTMVKRALDAAKEGRTIEARTDQFASPTWDPTRLCGVNQLVWITIPCVTLIYVSTVHTQLCDPKYWC